MDTEQHREFTDTIEFIGITKAVIYNVTANPQLVERVEGHILSTPTKYEACIELQRVAARVLTPLENCVFAALVDGHISEDKINPARLESIRTKCLKEWRRIGLLPLNRYMNISQSVLNEREAEHQQKRDADQRERDRQERINAAKLARMRPRDRRRALAKLEKEKAA